MNTAVIMTVLEGGRRRREAAARAAKRQALLALLSSLEVEGELKLTEEQLQQLKESIDNGKELKIKLNGRISPEIVDKIMAAQQSINEPDKNTKRQIKWQSSCTIVKILLMISWLCKLAICGIFIYVCFASGAVILSPIPIIIGLIIFTHIPTGIEAK